MDSDIKKWIGFALLTILAGCSWYLADLIPALMLSGRSIALIIIVTAAVFGLVEKIVMKYTGASKEGEEVSSSSENITS